MFLRFRACFRTLIYVFAYRCTRARAEKACKGTTFF